MTQALSNRSMEIALSQGIWKLQLGGKTWYKFSSLRGFAVGLTNSWSNQYFEHFKIIFKSPNIVNIGLIRLSFLFSFLFKSNILHSLALKL